MDFPGFRDEAAVLSNAVMDSVIREVINNKTELGASAIAERFVGAITSGERSFERLKALTLGAEIAPTGFGSEPAN